MARGITDAFLIGENFVGDDRVCLVLGDNIFYSPRLDAYLQKAMSCSNGACILGHHANNPRAFGVVELDAKGNAISLEENPKYPKSNFAVPGLYFYDNSVMDIAHHLQPSEQG